MSKDPLEELFGPISEEPNPRPARERLAFEQAERVQTVQMKTSDPGRGKGVKPWIIVGVVALVAIILAVVVVTVARGGGDSAATRTTAPKAPKTSTVPKPEPKTPEVTETPEAPKEGEVPKVDVGQTMELRIPSWNVTSQLSGKFGQTSYSFPHNDNVTLILDSPLINSLPESCRAMRTQWGVTRLESGAFEVAKPAERCTEAPEVYDELWGLTDAFAKSFKPL